MRQGVKILRVRQVRTSRLAKPKASLANNKGICFPELTMGVVVAAGELGAVPTEEDLRNLRILAPLVDAISLSFVRAPEEIAAVSR
jgi:pyruvate kinase